ncbi:hypothetical protein M422DRAFT_248715 [Sphaerobolus stellatus SS14]|nr:hypothetical protein M422DRAFT_248715 [Sphaerobolus stellatus SS14]
MTCNSGAAYKLKPSPIHTSPTSQMYLDLSSAQSLTPIIAATTPTVPYSSKCQSATVRQHTADTTIDMHHYHIAKPFTIHHSPEFELVLCTTTDAHDARKMEDIGVRAAVKVGVGTATVGLATQLGPIHQA